MTKVGGRTCGPVRRHPDGTVLGEALGAAPHNCTLVGAGRTGHRKVIIRGLNPGAVSISHGDKTKPLNTSSPWDWEDGKRSGASLCPDAPPCLTLVHLTPLGHSGVLVRRG